MAAPQTGVYEEGFGVKSCSKWPLRGCPAGLIRLVQPSAPVWAQRRALISWFESFYRSRAHLLSPTGRFWKVKVLYISLPQLWAQQQAHSRYSINTSWSRSCNPRYLYLEGHLKGGQIHRGVWIIILKHHCEMDCVESSGNLHGWCLLISSPG